MSSDKDKSDKIDEVANGLDELTTTVDELQDDPPDDVRPSTIDTLKRALEKASDAADEVENQQG
jgi:hypothetical protein